MMARTPVSNGSQVPGGRRPGVATISGPMTGSRGQLRQRFAQVEVEAGDAAHPLHHVDEVLPVRQMDPQDQEMARAVRT